MAKIVSLIQYVGKAGNTVGQKGPKGGIIFKQKAGQSAIPVPMPRCSIAPR